MSRIIHDKERIEKKKTFRFFINLYLRVKSLIEDMTEVKTQ